MRYTDKIKDEGSRGTECPGQEQLQTLEQLIKEGLYIDRTMQIKNLYCSGVSRCDYLLRPRGFGKRIFCDTLEALFTHDFERLKGAAACSSWTEPYRRVVRLDFARIARVVPERSVLVHGEVSQELYDRAINEGHAAAQLSAHANDDFRPVNDDPDNLQPPFMYSADDSQDSLTDGVALSVPSGSPSDESLNPLTSERRILSSGVSGSASSGESEAINPDGSEAGEDGDDLYIFGSALYSLIYEQITREDRGPSGAIMADEVVADGTAGSASDGDRENFSAMLSRCTERASFVNINQLLTRCRHNSRVLIIENFEAPLMAALDEPRLYNYRTRFIGAFLNLLGRNRKVFRHIIVTGSAAMDYREAVEEYPPLMKYLPLSRAFCFGKESSGLLGVTEEDLRSEQFRPFIDRAVTAMNNEFIAAGSPPPFDYDSMIRRLNYYYGNYSFDRVCTVLNPISVINFLRNPENGFRLYWFEHSTANFSALCKACRLSEEQLFMQLERVFRGNIRLFIEGCFMPVLINDEGLRQDNDDAADDRMSDSMHTKIQALLSAHPDVDMDRLLTIMQRVLKPATFRRFVKEFFPERYSSLVGDGTAESQEESSGDLGTSLGESLKDITFADDGTFAQERQQVEKTTAVAASEPSMVLDDSRDQDAGLANDYESTAQLRRANDNEALAQGVKGIPLPAMLFFMGYLTSARYQNHDMYNCMPSFEVYTGFKTLILNHFFNGNGNITRTEPLSDDSFFPYNHDNMIQLFHEVVSCFDARVLKEELTGDTLAAALMLWMQLHQEKSGLMATGTGIPLLRDVLRRRAEESGLADLASNLDLDDFASQARDESKNLASPANKSHKNLLERINGTAGKATARPSAAPAAASSAADAAADGAAADAAPAGDSTAALAGRPDIAQLRRALSERARAARAANGAQGADSDSIVAAVIEEEGLSGRTSKGDRTSDLKDFEIRNENIGRVGNSYGDSLTERSERSRKAGSGDQDYIDDGQWELEGEDILSQSVRDFTVESGEDVIVSTVDDGGRADSAAQSRDHDEQDGDSQASSRRSSLKERIRRKLRGRSELDKLEQDKSDNEDKTIEELLEEGVRAADAFMRSVENDPVASALLDRAREDASRRQGSAADAAADSATDAAAASGGSAAAPASPSGGTQSRGKVVGSLPGSDGSMDLSLDSGRTYDASRDNTMGSSADGAAAESDDEEIDLDNLDFEKLYASGDKDKIEKVQRLIRERDRRSNRLSGFDNLAIKFIRKPSARTIMNIQAMSEEDARSLWKHSLTRTLNESSTGVRGPVHDHSGRAAAIMDMIKRSADAPDPMLITDYSSYVDIINQFKIVIAARDCREKRDELSRISQIAYERGMTQVVRLADQAIARIDSQDNEVKGGSGWADFNDLSSVLSHQISHIMATRNPHEARTLIAQIITIASEQRLMKITVQGMHAIQRIMKGKVKNGAYARRLQDALKSTPGKAGVAPARAGAPGGAPADAHAGAPADAPGGGAAQSEADAAKAAADRQSLRELLDKATQMPDSVQKAIALRRIMLEAHENGDSDLELEILEGLTGVIKRLEVSNPGMMKKKLDETSPAPYYMSVRPVERQFGDHERMLSSLNLVGLMADPFNSGMRDDSHSNLTIYDNQSAMVLEIGIINSDNQQLSTVAETRKKLARVRNPLAAVLRQPRSFAATYDTTRVAMVVKNDYGDCSVVDFCNIDDPEKGNQHLNYEQVLAAAAGTAAASGAASGTAPQLQLQELDAMATAEAETEAKPKTRRKAAPKAASAAAEAESEAKPKARRTAAPKAAPATAEAEPEAKPKARRKAAPKAATAAAEAESEVKPKTRRKAAPKAAPATAEAESEAKPKARRKAASKAAPATAEAESEAKPKARSKAAPKAAPAAAEAESEAKPKARRKAAPKAAPAAADSESEDKPKTRRKAAPNAAPATAEAESEAKPKTRRKAAPKVAPATAEAESEAKPKARRKAAPAAAESESEAKLKARRSKKS